MPDSKKKILVFLSHAREDKPKVRRLSKRLKQDGFDPWLDEERLLPGQDWKLEIEKALRVSDVILLCFSASSLQKTGSIQREYKRAMKHQEEKPEGAIFVIPVRLDECEMPVFIQELQWVDYPEQYDRLKMALNQRLVEIDLPPVSVIPSQVQTKRVEIILEGEFSEFTPGRQQDIVSVLAALLRVESSQIRVLTVSEGSIIIILEMPDIAANRLYEIAEVNDYKIRSLGIKSILIEDREIIKLSDNKPQIVDSRPEQLHKTGVKRYKFQCWNCTKVYFQPLDIAGQQKIIVSCPYCRAESVVDLQPYLNQIRTVLRRAEDNDMRNEEELQLSHILPTILPTRKPDRYLKGDTNIPSQKYPKPFIIRPPDDFVKNNLGLKNMSHNLAIKYADMEVVTDDDLESMGRRLWETLDIQTDFDIAYREAGAAILPVMIESATAEVQALPWETLVHPEHGFLGKHPRFTLSRRIAASSNAQARLEKGPLRVLLFTSLPEDVNPETGRLNVEGEQEKMQEALLPWIAKGLVELEIPDDGRFSTLQDLLQNFRPHVLFLSGHGQFHDMPHANEAYGVFLFEDETGNKEAIQEDQIAEALSDTGVQAVILSACESGQAASNALSSGLMHKISAQGIPHVIGMRESIIKICADHPRMSV